MMRCWTRWMNRSRLPFPSSMESLTHLVSTESSSEQAPLLLPREQAHCSDQLARGRTPRSLSLGLLALRWDRRRLCQESGPPAQRAGREHGTTAPWKAAVPPWSARFIWDRTAAGGTIRNSCKSLGLPRTSKRKWRPSFEQSRPSLMDLSATVRKEETAMEPLLAADQPDEGKILAQIDRVAQARAELEKANAPHAPWSAPSAHPRPVEDASGRRAEGTPSVLQAGHWPTGGIRAEPRIDGRLISGPNGPEASRLLSVPALAGTAESSPVRSAG